MSMNQSDTRVQRWKSFTDEVKVSSQVDPPYALGVSDQDSNNST